MEIEGKSEYPNSYSMYEGVGPWSYAENAYYHKSFRDSSTNHLPGDHQQA
ncbi:hypothetical protein Patl1_15235 [Pistacia atlantica]|uniref:Uncharacterized protein n=1 Tax=Pistacia atlantica TaxID=434234 RepID=A0ACC1B5F0_9ROSI|nr:hypothetical protein Patl1_15235 [Pistacia atlantica]